MTDLADLADLTELPDSVDLSTKPETPDLQAASKKAAELAWIESVWRDLDSRHLYPTGSLGLGA